MRQKLTEPLLELEQISYANENIQPDDKSNPAEIIDSESDYELSIKEEIIIWIFSISSAYATAIIKSAQFLILLEMLNIKNKQPLLNMGGLPFIPTFNIIPLHYKENKKMYKYFNVLKREGGLGIKFSTMIKRHPFGSVIVIIAALAELFITYESERLILRESTSSEELIESISWGLAIVIGMQYLFLDAKEFFARIENGLLVHEEKFNTKNIVLNLILIFGSIGNGLLASIESRAVFSGWISNTGKDISFIVSEFISVFLGTLYCITHWSLYSYRTKVKILEIKGVPKFDCTNLSLGFLAFIGALFEGAMYVGAYAQIDASKRSIWMPIGILGGVVGMVQNLFVEGIDFVDLVGQACKKLMCKENKNQDDKINAQISEKKSSPEQKTAKKDAGKGNEDGCEMSLLPSGRSLHDDLDSKISSSETNKRESGCEKFMNSIYSLFSCFSQKNKDQFVDRNKEFITLSP